MSAILLSMSDPSLRPRPVEQISPLAGGRSATVPAAGQSAADVLHRRAEVWRQRPLLREIYRGYFDWIAAELAAGANTVELGGGSGHSREFLSGHWISDLVGTPWVDFAGDATRLPLRTGVIDNLFMVDVLHHLPQPGRFLEEARRVLRPGGRLIMVEPYISPASRLVFRLAHPEPVDLRVDPIPPDDRRIFPATGPFASNQAIPTLLFCHETQRRRFELRYPELVVRTLRRASRFVYPLSGGFSGPCLLPRWVWPAAWAIERMTAPLSRLLAFRLLVTLEHRPAAVTDR